MMVDPNISPVRTRLGFSPRQFDGLSEQCPTDASETPQALVASTVCQMSPGPSLNFADSQLSTIGQPSPITTRTIATPSRQRLAPSLSTERDRPVEWYDEASPGEVQRVVSMLKCHGFRTWTTTVQNSTTLLSQRGVLDSVAEILESYEERGRAMKALAAKSRQPSTDAGAKAASLSLKNKELNGKLESCQKQLSKCQDAEISRMRWDVEKRALEQQVGDLTLKARAMDAMLKAKEHDIEKMKIKLEKCIQQDRRRPAGERKLDLLQEENATLTKQCFLLQKEKEVQEREVDKLRKQIEMKKWNSGQPIEDSDMPRPAPLPMTIDLHRVNELEAELEREQSLRQSTETQMQEQRRVLEEHVASLAHELRAAKERERHKTYDQALMQEVQRLRDVEYEARKRWKMMNTKELMRRDRELQSLNILKTDLGLSRDEAIDLIKEVLRRLSISSAEELPSAIEALLEKRRGTEAMCQTEESAASSAEVLQALDTDCWAQAISRVETLKNHATSLQNVGRRIGVRRMADVSQEVERMLRVCDEQLAAKKIVDTLQSLLEVSSIEWILPAIYHRFDKGSVKPN